MANQDATPLKLGDAEKVDIDACTPREVATGALAELLKGSDAVDDSVLDGYYCIKNLDSFEKWISEHKSTLCNPALELSQSKNKILVMDLDNTLIARDCYSHDFVVDCLNGSRYSIKIHPMTLTFLHEMGQHYKGIAIYTSSSHVYANEIARQITMRYKEAYPDSKHTPFYNILSCNDCILVNGDRCKDLTNFGSLKNVVFVDDDPYYSMRNQNDNVIHVRRYHGQSSQEGGLMAIAPLLSFLSSVDSVPDTMHKLKKVWHNAGYVKVVQSTNGITC
ncbi:hypothetical protein MJO28_004407 [Puccinia striiformis f. sp. tritici]|uniref:Mitochondrial import inner membrane translocase subunit TIM50 n=4 Tax=Puccinia striiformis TaxID=27350 RepID=A0A0L0VJA9_9BASI|nr:hypothetical protein Pst134EA_007015 [Puccinia striiformis f. sp. tritici]KAI9608693.1 hypothetical protein H4Q26_004879 [Puccinia striiformis f. sp. tritici PST-130]KNE99372.1 hypothetical protein PSTG_07304 [Puccinia striiformis f. sp. tritici PST-78]POW07276.1 hypothetical protein PSTT_08348 [Puccinia striiformis]KAH9459928.1 hypothetical protein Pst134EB_008141 [Puccinia striiformis f. sp. tritici]KAH9469737.1 hypothetical protein Pst134EA_007015 [Puccinia striiformis f. sp. tritici]